jgi:hypothetical protein
MVAVMEYAVSMYLSNKVCMDRQLSPLSATAGRGGSAVDVCPFTAGTICATTTTGVIRITAALRTVV